MTAHLRNSDLPADLASIQELLFDKSGLQISSFQTDPESQEYAACSFRLNQKHIRFRTSKITPKKTGQFVAIWKRNQKGITQPFVKSDPFDYLLISARHEKNFGLFIFPKTTLIGEGIITDKKEGKRGMRIYPPWDHAPNKQAKKTQEWQIKYFLRLEEGVIPNPGYLKKLLAQ